MKMEIGTRVAYSVGFLRSIGSEHTDLAHARGTIIGMSNLGGLVLATIDWKNPDIPDKVNVANLAVVGPNHRFARC